MRMCFVCLKIKVLYISVQRASWKPNQSGYTRIEQQVIRADLTNEFVGVVFCFYLLVLKGLLSPSWKWANSVPGTVTHSQCFGQLRLKIGGKAKPLCWSYWNVVGIPRCSEYPLFHGPVGRKRLCSPGVQGLGVGLSVSRRKTQTRSASLSLAGRWGEGLSGVA